MLSEKAKSKAQQRFFGMVRAAQKGEMENPSSEVLDAADSMEVDDVKKFAKTKHKGLPEKKKIEEVAFLAGLAKGAAVAAKGMAKGAVKQKAKQVVKQKAANVAMGAIPQPNRDQQVQQLESKGTAELAAVKLRGRKACALCGSLAHATGQCPKKEHGDVNEGIGRTIGKVAGTVTKAAKAVNREVLPIKHAKNLEKEIKKGYDESKPKEVKKKINKKRNILQKGIGKVARAVSSKTDKIASTMGEARVDKGRSDYGKATIRNYRRFGPGHGEPAMFDPENKRGKAIEKRRQEGEERRGVKGAKVPAYKVDEGVVDKLKKFGEYLAPTPGKGTSNEPSVAAGIRTPKSTHMFKHVPSMNKDGTTGQYGKKGTTAVVQGVGNVAKKFAPTAKTVAKAALPVAGAVGAGLAVSKGVNSLMKMGKKKKIKEQILDELNLDELKLFGKKGSGAIFYNDPKGRRDALNATGKDPGAINKPAVDKAVNTVKTKVQKTVDTQTNRAGANIGNQISRKVQPAVSSGVADGIKQGATAVGKAALKGAGAVGAGLAVSKGVNSLMKGGKKKTNEELSIDETYFDTNRRGISTKGGFVKQYNKPGKLSRASLNHERKSKNPELRMSKKELRKSMEDDANYETKMGRSKPTPSNLKTALKKQRQSANNEELSIVDKMLADFAPTPLVLEKKKQPSVHDDYYDPMEDPTFDPHEAEATRGQSGRGTKGKMNVRKKYPVKEGYGKIKTPENVVGKVRQPKKVAAPKGSKIKEEVTNEALGAIAAGGAKVALGGAKLAGKAAVGGAKLAGKAAVKTAKVAGKVGKTVAKQTATTAANAALNTAKVAGSVVKRSGRAAVGAVKGALSNEEFTNEGVVDVIKKGTKRHKDAVEKKKIRNRKAVPYAALGASHELEGEEVVNELKTSTVKEDIGSFRDYMANVQAAKKRQQDKQDNRKKKDDAYIERVRKGIKFYDAKGSGRMVKGRKVYDKK